METENLQVQNVPSDGDCFYHAICLQTNRPKNSGGILRQEFIKFLYNLLENVRTDYAEKLTYNQNGPKGTNYEKARAFNAFVYQIKKGSMLGSWKHHLWLNF